MYPCNALFSLCPVQAGEVDSSFELRLNLLTISRSTCAGIDAAPLSPTAAPHTASKVQCPRFRAAALHGPSEALPPRARLLWDANASVPIRVSTLADPATAEAFAYRQYDKGDTATTTLPHSPAPVVAGDPGQRVRILRRPRPGPSKRS